MAKVILTAVLLLGSTALLYGCAGSNSPSQVHAPGREPTTKSQILSHGADMMQAMPPIAQINMYLDGVHFYADDLGRQIEAHHYCNMLNEDVHQCVIYDGNTKDAKLIGVEYIISKQLFEQLPEEEKKFWHSHHYEVKSGELIMPGVPGAVEKEAMKKLATTYGKTWHTWQVDRGDKLPLGVPQLMMGLTQDGQANKVILNNRDRRMGVSTEKKREERSDIPMPTVAPGANQWQSGQTIQLEPRPATVRNLHSPAAAGSK